jgi:hypothetical protein
MTTDALADDGSADARLSTGIRDQRLIVEGWIASHADSGTPGPHVHLRTNDRRNPVLKTSQVPELIDGLRLVAERIDRQWAADPAYPFGPDHNDPAVIRQERIAELQFVEELYAHFAEVAALLLAAEDMERSWEPIAAVLGVDEFEVSIRLGRVSLWAFPRRAAAARADELRALLAE